MSHDAPQSERPLTWGTPGPASSYPPASEVTAHGPAPLMRPQFAPVPWNRRALGWIIDFGLQQIISLVASIGLIRAEIEYFQQLSQAADSGSYPTYPSYPTSLLVWSGVSMLALLPWLYFGLYGRWIKGGTSGQSIGRKIAKTRLVNEATGQPIGIGMTIVRDLAHFLDNAALYLGWLWPLWDGKRQTFADKLLSTVVVNESDAPLDVRR